MLFHVTMTVRIPHDVDRETVTQLSEREHGRAAELQKEGKWLHLWRIAGQWANVSIFQVGDPGELHAILESLPLWPFIEANVVALCRHPGSIADVD
jgi:muconolactone D-isomerase